MIMLQSWKIIQPKLQICLEVKLNFRNFMTGTFYIYMEDCRGKIKRYRFLTVAFCRD